jgi:Ni/Fe-hydrogenase subunit HybB-like protein
VRFRGEGALSAHDFPPAFLAVAIVSGLSVLFFVRLSPHAGAEMSNRTHLRDAAEKKNAA